MKRRVIVLLFILLAVLVAQTGSITLTFGGRTITIDLRPLSTITFNLSSATADAAGNATLDVSIESSRRWPAGLQFELAYPPEVSGVMVTAGPAATAAAKDVQCAPQGPGVLRCLIVGLNTNAIQPGIVAHVSATASATSTINLQGLTAATVEGGSLNTTAGTAGTITLPTIVQQVSCTDPAWDTGLPMDTWNLEPGETIQCSLTLSQAAPAGGFPVPVMGIEQGVMVSDTTVAEGETTKAFTISR
jgi:hypothetical protein